MHQFLGNRPEMGYLTVVGAIALLVALIQCTSVMSACNYPTEGQSNYGKHTIIIIRNFMHVDFISILDLLNEILNLREKPQKPQGY